jgi:hypothetical protein
MIAAHLANAQHPAHDCLGVNLRLAQQRRKRAVAALAAVSIAALAHHGLPCGRMDEDAVMLSSQIML